MDKIADGFGGSTGVQGLSCAQTLFVCRVECCTQDSRARDELVVGCDAFKDEGLKIKSSRITAQGSYTCAFPPWLLAIFANIMKPISEKFGPYLNTGGIILLIMFICAVFLLLQNVMEHKGFHEEKYCIDKEVECKAWTKIWVENSCYLINHIELSCEKKGVGS